MRDCHRTRLSDSSLLFVRFEVSVYYYYFLWYLIFLKFYYYYYHYDYYVYSWTVISRSSAQTAADFGVILTSTKVQPMTVQTTVREYSKTTTTRNLLRCLQKLTTTQKDRRVTYYFRPSSIYKKSQWPIKEDNVSSHAISYRSTHVLIDSAPIKTASSIQPYSFIKK